MSSSLDGTAGNCASGNGVFVGAEGAKPPLRLWRSAVLSRLKQIRTGGLTLRDGAQTYRFGQPGSALQAQVEVHDRRFYSGVALRGSVGAGETYARQAWSTPDLTAVVRLFVRNREALNGLERGLASISRPCLAFYHALRPNSRKGSHRNIQAHYDLSNDFFGLFLDDTLTYSCGFFEHPAASLREASLAKVERLCRKLNLKAGEHLLEIGSGWGALAIHAARHHGCRVTTCTLSQEQKALTEARVRAAGLQDQVQVLLSDYRDLEGHFDKLVSVEMIEAIGHRQYLEFFEHCAKRLRSGGRMALQSITIADHVYPAARRSVDFIKRHIFPGSCIPSVTALISAASRRGTLRLSHLEDIGCHYAPTLAAWRQNLRARRSEALALGFSEHFLRLWEFYFAYCEGGYAEQQLGNAQMVFDRV